MTVQVVLVHGIRTSATMWRAQVEYLTERGIPVDAVDLPGHGSRMSEEFTLESAFATIDDAVRAAAQRGPVLLAGHSMGGLLCIEYVGAEDPPPVAAFIAASCTAIPRGVALQTYRFLTRRFDALPDRGMWLTDRMLDRILPDETRADFGAGGYALDAQDAALRSLSVLDLLAALRRLGAPLWVVYGQYDQLRVNERLFLDTARHAELVVVPRTTHHVTVMRPRVFNALLEVAIATIEASAEQRPLATADGVGHEAAHDRQDAAHEEQQPESTDQRDEPRAQQRSDELAEARRDVDETEVARVVLGKRQQVGAERESDRHVGAVSDTEEGSGDHRRRE
jgi:pimeloyl-ACP methyl ester carboxylesterase